ncbi:MAG: hypothetical protein V7K97_14350 [Nostoc sp.]|uniref:hypothetical protein n=1 Tax=Nostoc sp. TaxID=1180 RepID=UPI002FFB9E90
MFGLGEKITDSLVARIVNRHKDLPEVEGLVAEDIANQNIETFRATLSELEAAIQEFTAARVGLIGELQVHLAWFAEKNLGNRFVSHEIYCTQLNRIAEAEDILCSVRAPVGRLNITLDKIIIGRGLSNKCFRSKHKYFRSENKYFR